MEYKQMVALEKGERLAVYQDGEWKKGTFDRYISGADPSMWFAFDEVHKGKKFRKLSEDELNAELIGKMGVEA